ncbi:acyltransferase family protein [Sphingomonas pituitosa]|uniref:acyltransferase family protein n=1 Tax=Sphingomonas pituitosa TaxID=99597 RepID=UPI000836A74C|nr:acyltransferase [Sphingomonas pituitosa]
MSVTGARTLDATSDGKPHFDVLDGLRGTAALLVVAFHIQGITVLFEASRLLLPHAYLAVDFFFALSGFVVGYAYDDRWGRMTVREFLARRLVRLHPLVVLGTVLGLASYCVDQPRRIESATSSLNGISPSISQQGGCKV